MTNSTDTPAVLGPVERQVRPGAEARPLVERLRSGVYGTNRIPLCEEAAEEIERLLDFLTIWISDGSLQTFEHREKFRAEAKVLLGA